MSKKYETVIGLEVHVRLSTQTKAFCGCSTTFGAEPNTHVCPVCLGLPGVLPVYNKKAFEYAIKVAIALNCDIQKIVKFDRKNYYYPDLPKNYQISQYDMPLAYNGKITITDADGQETDIGITRAHLEEDAGKLLHDKEKAFSYVDLNRTGMPLVEIVSEPDMHSPEQAYQYLTTLKQTIKYLGVSDCNMEEGSLKCDANISLREKGAKELGSKVEIKNLNSFKAVRESLAFEEVRQEEALEEGEKIPQETRLWDENRNVTESMRTKEEAQDYRYFPDPDLVPFEVQPGLVEQIRSSIPELPQQKKERFTKQYGLNEKDIEVLASEKPLADFYEAVVSEYDDPQAVCNWVKGEVMMHVKDLSTDIESLGLKPADLAKIITMAKKGTISGLAAKDVLRENIATGKDPEKIVKEKGLEQVSDEGELESIVSKVIEQNEGSANDFKGGKENALSFLVGQVMRQSKGKANPKLAGEMLRKKLTK
ncbi:MAG: Asp-tRNA(Asn)/Glu-tRNA(Gln) amidotransferase subunit GatB [Candidatus Omnitrophota bacterium]